MLWWFDIILTSNRRYVEFKYFLSITRWFYISDTIFSFSIKFNIWRCWYFIWVAIASTAWNLQHNLTGHYWSCAKYWKALKWWKYVQGVDSMRPSQKKLCLIRKRAIFNLCLLSITQYNFAKHFIYQQI